MMDKIDLGTPESPSRPLPKGSAMKAPEVAHASQSTPPPTPTRPPPNWCFSDRLDNPMRFPRRMD